jgi:hypothetical protein
MCLKERRWSEVGAPGGVGRALASPWFHRLSIIGLGWLPKVVVKAARVKIWPVMWFGGRLEGSKSMTVDPWIQDHSIMTIDANRLKSTHGRACGEAPMDWWCGQCQGGTWGPCGALVGLASGPKAFYHVHLSPCVHICHIFAYFCSNFLHTNKSPCTSGNMWIINIIITYVVLPCLVQCWWSK